MFFSSRSNCSNFFRSNKVNYCVIASHRAGQKTIAARTLLLSRFINLDILQLFFCESYLFYFLYFYVLKGESGIKFYRSTQKVISSFSRSFSKRISWNKNTFVLLFNWVLKIWMIFMWSWVICSFCCIFWHNKYLNRNIIEQKFLLNFSIALQYIRRIRRF